MLTRRMIVAAVHRRLAGGRGIVAFLIVFGLTGACPPVRDLLPRQADRCETTPVGTPRSAVAAPEERPAGNDLFVRSCARCHGKDGKGGPARDDMPAIPDFSSHKWQEQHSDAILLASIMDGKGKEMPAFGEKLTREKAQEVVAFIRKLDPDKSKPAEKPAAPPEKPTAAAVPGPRALAHAATMVVVGNREVQTVFQQRCARCHGADGKGEEARDATPEIPDFTSHAWQERRSDAQVRVTIRDGKGKGMPAFGDKLSPEFDRDLAVYLRSFDATRTTAPTEPDSTFEQRFQQLEQELQALRKQLRDLEAPPPKP